MRAGRRVARLVLAVALATLAVVAPARPAAAHAVLESSTPADGTRLGTAPPEVVLDFSEGVGAAAGAVRVFDGTGTRVDTGELSALDDLVTVQLQSGLGDGAYVVTFRVISEDGHPVRGAFTFTVGDAAAADDALVSSVFDEGADRGWEVADAVLRALAYAGALLAAGGALYLAAVHDGRRPGTARLLRGAAAAGGGAALAHLVVQAHLATGLGLGSLFRGGVARDVLGDGVGAAAAVVVLGLALVAAGLGASARGVRESLLLVGGVLGATGFAVTGHTTVSDPVWLVSAADVVHLLAAATWFGGLVLLAGDVAAARRGGGQAEAGGVPADVAATGSIVGRFSTVATVAVLAVGAAGLALSWSEVRSLDNLTSTTYGRLLLAKVGVVALVALAGAYNHLRLVPALRSATADAPRTSAWRLLRRTLRFEVGAILVALAVTGVLVQVTPARAVASGPEAVTVPLGEGSVQIVVDPARVGPTTMHLYLLDATGRPAELAPEGLAVALSLPSADIGPLDEAPFDAGPGHYQLDGDLFPVAGTWQVDLVARVSRFEEATATAEVRIRP